MYSILISSYCGLEFAKKLQILMTGTSWEKRLQMMETRAIHLKNSSKKSTTQQKEKNEL